DRLRSFFNKDPAYLSKHKALCGSLFLIPVIQRTFLNLLFRSGCLLSRNKQEAYSSSLFYLPFYPTGEVISFSLSLKQTRFKTGVIFACAKVLISFLLSKL
ncbi:MAG TPA: hypothetical protein VK927_01650, partial [Adhaeribacter sp.]|nr:hypothetical protein [Adhaeribacter sp.]